MGVDAEILIKITKPEAWLDETMLRRYSSRLTSIIGVQNFMINKEEKSYMSVHHALEIIGPTDEDGEDDPNGRVVYRQDGDDIVPEENEQFLRCHVYQRYYGEKYARGDWKTLFFIMCWLNMVFQGNAEVWYGGDSSGICVEHMTADRLMEMTQHYLSGGGDTYWMNKPSQYRCEFCDMGAIHTGGGGCQGHEFYRCDGCDGEWIVVKNGWENPTYTPCGKKDKFNTGHFTTSENINRGTATLYPFNGVFELNPGAANRAKNITDAVKELEAGE